jgi:hypothetical protein
MFRQFLIYVTSAALVMGTMPARLGAQPPMAAGEQDQVEKFSTAQLEALLAPMQVQFDAIQRLRAKAQGAGNLHSTPQQIVRTEPAPPVRAAAVGRGIPAI